MPLCPRHHTQIITDVYGISRCARCEEERRFADTLYCHRCGAPVQAPGLCADCARPLRREQMIVSLANNAWWIVILMILIALGLILATRPFENLMPESPPQPPPSESR
jgi:predicted amidophosphoribosyltransferase